MEMPASLRPLPPETLDILRHYGRTGQIAAYSDDIISGSGLSDRAFGKGVRRLVTRSYVMMDGSQQYRLTENGRRLLAELLEYDLDPEADEPQRPMAAPRQPSPPRFVRRRVLLASPDALVAGETTTVHVAFEPAEEGERVDLPIQALVRVSMLHGSPAEAQERAIRLENRSLAEVFEISAERYTTARIRVEVCQNGADSDGCGGLYVDLPVSAASDGAAQAAFTAFGSDLMLLDSASAGAAENDERSRLLDEFDF